MLLLLAAAAAVTQIDYRDAATWLCRPGRGDACAGDLATTRVGRDGIAQREAAPKRRVPGADCFYVYPTVSLDPSPNSDMVAGPEERGMAAAQFAPYRSECRTFAPLYRQVTLTALRQRLRDPAVPLDFDTAYGDVRAAWRDYLARDNQARPIVLVGHSQGSALLKRLLAEEIDGKPVQRRLLSAIIPGTAVLVPVGKVVGGDLKTIPLCRAARQTGCVVTWASYRDVPGPPTHALFGVSNRPGYEAGCTNPARLGGGNASLDPILGFPWWRGGVAQYRQPAAWSANGTAVATRFVHAPGLLSGACVRRGGVSYLAVHVRPGSARDLAEATVGAATVGDLAYPDWGFHVLDTAIVQGDTLRLVAAQAAAWRAANLRKR